eukprot:15966-Alexandrium_andersonii.AAC.1
MSASLVGSEMCIRDRLRGSPCPPKTLGRAGERACVRACVHACMCAGAVSYTHLTLPTICSV